MNKISTRRIAALAASATLGAALATSLVSAPEAGASTGTYLQALNDRGLVITDTATMIKTGFLVCTALNDTNGADVIAALVNKVGYSNNEAGIILVSAVEELCPWHDHRGEANSRSI